MLECRMVPEELKERLVELKKLRKEQTAALPTGSQKAFFARVWKRLHTDESKGKQAQQVQQAQQAAAAETQESPQNNEDKKDTEMISV